MSISQIKIKYFGGMSSAISLEKVGIIDFLVRYKNGFKIKRGSENYNEQIYELSKKPLSELVEMYRNT